MVGLGNITAGGTHGVFYFGNRVGRASGKLCVVAVQHRDVVVMIARGENGGARDLGEAGKLFQGGAFVISGVAKAQINRVALKVKFGMPFACAVDEFRDPFHFFVARRDQTFQAAFGMIDETRLGLLGHKIDNFREN